MPPLIDRIQNLQQPSVVTTTWAESSPPFTTIAFAGGNFGLPQPVAPDTFTFTSVTQGVTSPFVIAAPALVLVALGAYVAETVPNAFAVSAGGLIGAVGVQEVGLPATIVAVTGQIASPPSSVPAVSPSPDTWSFEGGAAASSAFAEGSLGGPTLVEVGLSTFPSVLEAGAAVISPLSASDVFTEPVSGLALPGVEQGFTGGNAVPGAEGGVPPDTFLAEAGPAQQAPSEGAPQGQSVLVEVGPLAGAIEAGLAEQPSQIGQAEVGAPPDILTIEAAFVGQLPSEGVSQGQLVLTEIGPLAGGIEAFGGEQLSQLGQGEIGTQPDTFAAEVAGGLSLGGPEAAFSPVLIEVGPPAFPAGELVGGVGAAEGAGAQSALPEVFAGTAGERGEVLVSGGALEGLVAAEAAALTWVSAAASAPFAPLSLGMPDVVSFLEAAPAPTLASGVEGVGVEASLVGGFPEAAPLIPWPSLTVGVAVAENPLVGAVVAAAIALSPLATLSEAAAFGQEARAVETPAPLLPPPPIDWLWSVDIKWEAEPPENKVLVEEPLLPQPGPDTASQSAAAEPWRLVGPVALSSWAIPPQPGPPPPPPPPPPRRGGGGGSYNPFGVGGGDCPPDYCIPPVDWDGFILQGLFTQQERLAELNDAVPTPPVATTELTEAQRFALWLKDPANRKKLWRGVKWGVAAYVAWRKWRKDKDDDK